MVKFVFAFFTSALFLDATDVNRPLLIEEKAKNFETASSQETSDNSDADLDFDKNHSKINTLVIGCSKSLHAAHVHEKSPIYSFADKTFTIEYQKSCSPKEGRPDLDFHITAPESIKKTFLHFLKKILNFKKSLLSI